MTSRATITNMTYTINITILIGRGEEREDVNGIYRVTAVRVILLTSLSPSVKMATVTTS
jgi:hypothetical protein